MDAYRSAGHPRKRDMDAYRCPEAALGGDMDAYRCAGSGGEGGEEGLPGGGGDGQGGAGAVLGVAEQHALRRGRDLDAGIGTVAVAAGAPADLDAGTPWEL
jgi:hypothetical protein